MISLTFGNIDVQNCLRNAVSLLHHTEREIEWRSKHGRNLGFDALRAWKPTIAVGATEPLADQRMMADYFRKFRMLRKTVYWAHSGQMALTVWGEFTPSTHI